MGLLRWFKAGRPSGAMLVAIIAVVIAMTAPGYAAQLVRTVFFAKKAGNAQKVDGLRASKTPRANTLLALDSQGKFPSSVVGVGPRGPQGVQGAQGPRGPQGLQGDRGNVGAPGSALAYSMIVKEPEDSGGPPVWRIDDTFSKLLDNDINFSNPQPGVYCLSNLGFKVSNVVASAGPFGSTTPFFVAAEASQGGLRPVNNACPANTGAVIYAVRTDGTVNDPPDTSDTIYFTLN